MNLETIEQKAKQNDAFRTGMVTNEGHRLIITSSVEELRKQKPESFKELIRLVMAYDSFDEETDPDHEAGVVIVDGQSYLFNIEPHGEPGKTPFKLMTIMRSEEY